MKEYHRIRDKQKKNKQTYYTNKKETIWHDLKFGIILAL